MGNWWQPKVRTPLKSNSVNLHHRRMAPARVTVCEGENPEAPCTAHRQRPRPEISAALTVYRSLLSEFICLEGTTAEELPPSDWPVAVSGRDDLNQCERAESTVGGTILGQLTLGCIRKSPEHEQRASKQVIFLHGSCIRIPALTSVNHGLCSGSVSHINIVPLWIAFGQSALSQ